MPEAVTGGVLWKKVFVKILQNSQEAPVSEKTPVNFAKFLRTLFFTEQLLTSASEMRVLQKPSERKKLSLL